MSVQSEIDRIITAVGNAYSKVSEKGGTVPASQTVANLATAIDSIPSGGAKETWVIKRNAAGEFATTQISFTSNGQKFTSIGANYDGFVIFLYYDNNEIANFDPGASSGFEFYDEADRKLTFDTPPTGALLTWLQSNAVKQPDDTAVQDTKSVTITSNGTVSVTPDAPYDGLSSVDVTVNVSGGDFKIEFGSFTPAHDSGKNGYIVTHSLGTAPYIISYYTSNSVGGHYNKNGASIASIGSNGFIKSDTGFDGLKSGSSDLSGSSSKRYGSTCHAITSISDTSFTIGKNRNYSSSIGCKAGVTYYWVAIA